MFRKSLALSAFALLTLVGAANAAGFDGYYIGLNAGQGMSETDTTRTITGTGYFAVTSPPAIESASAMALDEETFAGGAHLGVNWPLGEHFFIGAEVDAMGFGNDTSGAAVNVPYPCCASTFTTTNSLEQTWVATGRARLGVTAGFFMAYATGGYAGSDMKFTQTFSDTSNPIPLEVVENSEFRSGFSYGGGIEVLIESGASLRVEYLYMDLGEIEAVGPIAAAAPGSARVSTGRAEVTDQFVRVGLNFQMD